MTSSASMIQPPTAAARRDGGGALTTSKPSRPSSEPSSEAKCSKPMPKWLLSELQGTSVSGCATSGATVRGTGWLMIQSTSVA